MKKIFGTILILLTLSALTAAEVIHTYHFGSPEINKIDNWETVDFQNCRQSGKLGEPTLPYKAVSLVLPQGRESTGLEIIFSDPVEIAGNINLYPAQAVRPISYQGSSGFSYNEAIYRSAAVYPTKADTGAKTAFKNGHSIAMTTFTPLFYNPVNQTAGYYQTAEIIMQTKSTAKAAAATKFLREDAKTLKSISNLIDNPEELNSMKSDREANYEVMLITDEAFADNFEELRTHYLSRGLRLQIFTTAEINSDYAGADLSEKMRNGIIEEYINSEISYVVLAGDNEQVPSRGFYCYVVSGDGVESSDIPSDVYFSALDGNWNDDGDTFWAEPEEDDLLPEIAVGRIPFSTETDLDNVINKIISYEDNPILGELESPLMIGENLWNDPLTWGADYMDILQGWHDENGYETEGIPLDQNFTTLYDRDLGNWTSAELITEINNGHSYLHHSGHANAGYNMRLYNNDITNENFSAIDGEEHNFTLVYTHGCISGAFDEDDCIAERMLNIENFMVAGTFNSRYGWFNEGQTEGPSEHLHREYLNAIYANGINEIGAAHMESKIASAPWVTADGQHEFGALRWCFYTANVIGDPTLKVWKGEPMDAELSYEPSVGPETTILEYQVTADGTLYEGATITLVLDGEFLTKTTTDENGQAIIDCASLLQSPATVDIYVSSNDFVTIHVNAEFGMTSTDDDLTLKTALNSAYPNPFNPETNISFSLAEAGNVKLEIYNARGQKVKTLLNDKTTQGEHNLVWNGTDDSNKSVASGLYFYKLQTSDKNMTKKMMLIK